MISGSIFAIATLIAILILFSTRDKRMKVGTYQNKPEFNIKWLYMPLLVFISGVIIALVQPYVIDRVDAGHVGIKINLTGDSRGVSKYEYKTGWVVYNTWTEDLHEFPTYQQHIDYPPQAVITKGGFSAEIMPSFNYSLVAGNVGDMFQNLRVPVKSVEQGWLKTAIVGSVNDVANKWNVDSIFNNREYFESAIIAECNKRVSKWFTISQLRTNITPPEALRTSIEAKTQAIQEVKVAENQKNVAEAEAARKVAVARGNAMEQITLARGDSAAAVIRAAGEAEAIKRKQVTLTPLYIEYLKIQQWDGKTPTTVLAAGASTIVSVK